METAEVGGRAGALGGGGRCQGSGCCKRAGSWLIIARQPQASGGSSMPK